VSQIVEAIDPIYLQSLLNRATGQYATIIRAVVTHLFATHGKITPQQVKATEQSVYGMHYDITQPVDVVFTTIKKDLADLAEHANSPSMSEQQQIDMAYVILARQPILQHDVRLWHRRPLAERTWANMLAHFREAQADLRALPTVGEVYPQQPPHQANAVDTMAALVVQCLLESIPIPHEPIVKEAQANALQTRETELQARKSAMHSQMQEMMALMRASTGISNPGNNRSRTSSYRGRGGRHNDRNHGRGRGRTPNACSNTRENCWSLEPAPTLDPIVTTQLKAIKLRPPSPTCLVVALSAANGSSPERLGLQLILLI
jgi:hypothetical protein